METEISMVVARGRRGSSGGCCFMGVEFLFCEMKRILEVDAGDSCTNVNILDAIEPYT